MNRSNGADLLVSALESLEVSVVFGIPGIHNLDIYDRLLASPIRHVTSRNESGAAFMADGYARSTGEPGVALVISGPGLTNALTPLGEARHDAVPLVLISSDIPRRYRNGPAGYLHQLESPTAMTASVTKESLRIENLSEIEPALRYLFHRAVEGRPGPVHLEIPIDVLQELQDPADSLAESAEPLRAAVATARDPWIIAGGGAVGAVGEVQRLAETLGAPVVTTAAGKGVLPETHPLSVGGRLHLPAVRSALERADLLFVLGTQLSSTDLWVERLKPTGTVVAINIDAAHLATTLEPDIPIRGNLREILPAFTQLADNVRGQGGDAINVGGGPDHGSVAARNRAPVSRSDATDRVVEILAAARNQLPTVLGVPASRVERMRSVLIGISNALGENGVLAADMTTIAYCGISEYPVRRPGGFLHPAGFGTLGYALPAAIGVALRRETPPVAVLAGDGGFQFTLQELAVAVQERLPIPIVIWNDNGYGEIRREEEARHPGKRIAVDNLAPDFLALAGAYGAAGYRVDDPDRLAAIVTDALSHPGPTIIEVPASDREGSRDE